MKSLVHVRKWTPNVINWSFHLTVLCRTGLKCALWLNAIKEIDLSFSGRLIVKQRSHLYSVECPYFMECIKPSNISWRVSWFLSKLYKGYCQITHQNIDGIFSIFCLNIHSRISVVFICITSFAEVKYLFELAMSLYCLPCLLTRHLTTAEFHKAAHTLCIPSDGFVGDRVSVSLQMFTLACFCLDSWKLDELHLVLSDILSVISKCDFTLFQLLGLKMIGCLVWVWLLFLISNMFLFKKKLWDFLLVVCMVAILCNGALVNTSLHLCLQDFLSLGSLKSATEVRPQARDLF